MFFYKIIKKSYMCTFASSSERDYVLFILFQLYGSKTGLFEGNLFWVGHNDPPPPMFILGEKLIQS